VNLDMVMNTGAVARMKPCLVLLMCAALPCCAWFDFEKPTALKATPDAGGHRPITRETSSPVRSTPEVNSMSDEGTANTGPLEAGTDGAPQPTIPIQIAHSEVQDSASGPDNTGASTPNVVLTKPAETQAGDLLLLLLASDHPFKDMGSERLRDLGWTLIDQENFGDDDQQMYLMYRVADALEPASYTFEGVNPGLSGMQGLLLVYRGVDPQMPVNAYETTVVDQGEDKVETIVTPTPAIRTTKPNCLAIAGLVPDIPIDAPMITGWPDGFTENQLTVLNPRHPYPFGWAAIYTAERPLPEAGAVPTSTFTWQQQNALYYFGATAFVLAIAPSG
jgi:hypothetical protein